MQREHAQELQGDIEHGSPIERFEFQGKNCLYRDLYLQMKPNSTMDTPRACLGTPTVIWRKELCSLTFLLSWHLSHLSPFLHSHNCPPSVLYHLSPRLLYQFPELSPWFSSLFFQIHPSHTSHNEFPITQVWPYSTSYSKIFCASLLLIDINLKQAPVYISSVISH